MNKEQIEQLALDCAKSITKNETYQFYIKEAFRSGFEKASELLYTEEQVRKAMDISQNAYIDNGHKLTPLHEWEIIQSLKQQ